MKKGLRFLCALASLVFPSMLYAQPSFDWVRTLNPASGEHIATTQTNSIVNDTAGNVYSSGFFSGTVDFDPGTGVYNLVSTAGRSSFILKLNAQGNFVWAIMVGDTGTVESASLSYSPTGNLFMSGAFSADNDFDPGPGVFMLNKIGSRNAFVLNVDLNGNFVWARSFGGTPNYVQSSWCAADPAGNVVVSSAFNGTMDADPGPGVQNLVNTTSTQDIFIIKLDPAGNLVWAHQLGSPNTEFSLSLAMDQTGNVFTTGYYTNTLDFDPGVGTFNMTSNAGSRDVFLLKLDPAGGFVWAKSFGSQGMELAQSVVTDASNNVLLSGSFNYTVDFDPNQGVYNLTSTSSLNAPDIFVVKLDSEGELVWARNWTHYGCGYGFCITTDRDDAVYINGNFKNTFDLDPGTGSYVVTATSVGPTDLFILKLDAAGNFVWGVSAGGTMHVYGYGITVDKYYGVYTNGSFSGIADFDPDQQQVFSVTATNAHNFYMHKMKQNLNIGMPENDPANALHIYPNPITIGSGNGILNIVDDEVADVIVITDVLGNEVLRMKPQSVNVMVDLSRFADGVYFVQINNADKMKTARVILQR